MCVGVCLCVCVGVFMCAVRVLVGSLFSRWCRAFEASPAVGCVVLASSKVGESYNGGFAWTTEIQLHPASLKASGPVDRPLGGSGACAGTVDSCNGAGFGACGGVAFGARG